MSRFSEQELIEKAKAYAEDNYDNGMDRFVECFGKSDWVNFVHHSELEDRSGLMSWAEIKNSMRSLRNWDAEMQTTGEW